MELKDLKSKIFTLLKEDEEFRYAVAGMLGLEEILKRLDRHEAELVRLREDMNKLREDMNKLREDMIVGFRRHDEILEKHAKEIAKLREDMNTGFKRHDEEIAKLREDMVAGFKRHDEEITRLREDMKSGFERHDKILMRHEAELIKLREDMNRGFELLRRHIDALGARWGMLSEQAFREGLKGLIEKEFGLRVEKWVRRDDEGYVFGYPSDVDVDVAVHKGRVILVEVKSHVGRGDVYIFKRKAEFYEMAEGRKPARLIIVTPYADEDALEAARSLQVEVYTKL
ncbi:DUF3782 domain-containing protein [Candidatus Bathyarchaeota archaeon]|nr:DUF3782 domain-containing protein [Candidatus Bathyarchaeota archaeon]